MSGISARSGQRKVRPSRFCRRTHNTKEIIMSDLTNKQIIQDIFSELAKGNSRPFVESMANDFRWILPGTNQWSRTFDGKNAVLTELFGMLSSTLTGPVITTAQ